MEDNIFTGNIFIEILVRFEGNLSSFDDKCSSVRIIEKSNRESRSNEARSSSIFDLFRQQTELNVLNKFPG